MRQHHPWVTKNGTDPLLSAEANCAHLVEPPNELELNRAFTRKLNHMFCVMRAIHRFKSLLANIRLRARGLTDATATSSKGDAGQPELDPAEAAARIEETEEIEALLHQRRSVLEYVGSDGKGPTESMSEQEPLFLGIGTGARDDFAMDEATPDVVSDSPTAVDFDVYDRAYEDAIEQQMRARGGTSKPTLYLTRFVKDSEHLTKLANLVEGRGPSPGALKAEMKDSRRQLQRRLAATSSGKLAQLVSKVGISNSKTPGPETRQQNERGQ